MTAHAPVLLWAIALGALGLVGLPYAYVACSRLPDRGVAVARPLGLLLVGTVTWWLASLDLLPFSRGTIAVAVVVVAAGGIALVAPRRHDLRTWLGAHRRLILVEEGVFWALFGAATLVRYLNPDLWHPLRGGEKPMDFAFLNAVLKSTHFPPFDPWFAGGRLNYYYYGFVLVAVLVKATGIASAVAYNLAVPTLFALLGASSFGLVLSLVSSERATSRLRARTGVALLGVAFVVLLGNLGEIRVLRSALRGSVPIEWWYWNATRVVHRPPNEPGLITEFPAFTYLYADLHAHAMALPFAALVLVLATAVVRGRRGAPDRTASVTLFFLLALGIGSMWPINSWDFPTYAVVGIAAIAVAGTLQPAWWRPAPVVRTLVQSVALLGFAYVFFLPFHLHYRSVFEGVERWRGSRTPLGDYLTVHGVFLFAVGSALLVDFWTSRDLNPLARSLRLMARTWRRAGRRRELTRTLVVRRSLRYRSGAVALSLSGAGVVTAITYGEFVTALAVVIATACGLAFVRRPRRATDPDAAMRRFLLVLVALGLALTIAVEYLVVRNIDVGRVNTVFKTYLQVWLLWAVAAAAAAAFVYSRLQLLPRALRVAWRGSFIVLVVVAALYPILATPAKIDDRFDRSVGPTLDGSAFMKKAVFEANGSRFRLVWDGDAIRWLLDHVRGFPVVAEVNTYPALYAWGDRYAMFTGNPTIVGWDYHERQQRPWQADEVARRIRDVQEAYRTTDPARARRLLARYGTRYIVVGPLERAYFPEGFGKWALGAGRLWSVVYRNPGVEILRLRPR
jgi:YYY domain-containing protein